MPRLNVWEPKQLPDAAGPVGGKRKTRKSTNKKKNKKTRSKEQKGGLSRAEPLLLLAARIGDLDNVKFAIDNSTEYFIWHKLSLSL